jgi:hypothetical protein
MSPRAKLLGDCLRSAIALERVGREHATLVHALRLELDDGGLENELSRVERALSDRLVADRMLLEKVTGLVRTAEGAR